MRNFKEIIYVTLAALALLMFDGIGEVAKAESYTDVIDVTLVTSTDAYADNDVLAVPQEIKGFFRVPGGVTKIKSIRVLDEADQAQDIDILFMNATGTLGTINDAVSATDAVAQTVLTTVNVLIADYDDYINAQVAVKEGLDILVKGADTSRSVWIAAVLRSGTPTYAASSLKLKIGVERF